MARKPKIKYSFDFEALYHRYPNKEGKGRGLQILEVSIKTPEQFAEFTAAMDNYLLACARDGREGKYVKHWVTFVRNWNDYSTNNFEAPATTLRSQAERILKGKL